MYRPGFHRRAPSGLVPLLLFSYAVIIVLGLLAR